MTDYNEIPGLYETETTPVEDKIIHQHYYLPQHQGIYWLIAEYDPEEQLGFGYACLNDPEMAEWGLIPIHELEDAGAVLNEDWEPCPFKEAIQKVRHGDAE